MDSKIKITSADCANYLGLSHIGDVVEVKQAVALNAECVGGVKFISSFREDYLKSLNSNINNFIVAHDSYQGLLHVPHVLSKNPRLDFSKLTKQFFSLFRGAFFEKSAVIGNDVKIGEGVYLGHNVVIEDNVSIGNYTTILHNVIISKNTKIGNSCTIKSGTVVGQKGFGFERDEEGIPIEFTHYGRVIVGNYVEIGALNTVVAGSLSDTIIEDYVKTDDHVHIAHNVVVGKASLITACAEISGSVRIGKYSWLGPNCSIVDKVVLGDNIFIGLGAVVTRSFSECSVIAGNPARILRKIEE